MTKQVIKSVSQIKEVNNRISNEIVNDINTMLCPIKSNSNTIELTVHTSSYCVLDLLCKASFSFAETNTTNQATLTLLRNVTS